MAPRALVLAVLAALLVVSTHSAPLHDELAQRSRRSPAADGFHLQHLARLSVAAAPGGSASSVSSSRGEIFVRDGQVLTSSDSKSESSHTGAGSASGLTLGFSKFSLGAAESISQSKAQSQSGGR